MKAAAVLASILLAVVAAGCGGKSKPTASDWAGNLCSAVTSWTDELKSTATTLTSDPTLDGLKSAKSDVSSATDEFVNDLKKLGKPNTDAGDQAKETTDKLAGELDQAKQELNDAVDNASGVQGVVSAATAVQATLSKMATQFQAAFTSLQALDTKGELEDAFQSADSCKKLAQSSS